MGAVFETFAVRLKLAIAFVSGTIPPQGVGADSLIFGGKASISSGRSNIRPDEIAVFETCAVRPGTKPGTGTAYHPSAQPTVGPYELPVPGFIPGRTG